MGIDSFAAIGSGESESKACSKQSMSRLLERIAHAENAGLHFFGIGEHHRKEFLDAAPALILAAAAA